MSGEAKDCERPCHGPRFLLTDVWRTCDKIRAAVFRSGLNLWSYFDPLDPEKKCLIPESQFVNILGGPLKDTIGLSCNEISQLANYFRVYDGRIFYTQFCKIIHDTVPDIYKNPPLITGLEWSDPYEVNSLSPAEECRLQLLLSKIAIMVHVRHLVLRPYFQDYELIAKNAGTVTIKHFAQVLYYLKILVHEEDFQLLVKKFGRDSYTVNYIAFCSAVDNITYDLDDKAWAHLGNEVVRGYPGQPIRAELPKLPRPEVGRVRTEAVFGAPNVFHPVLLPPRRLLAPLETLRRMQRFILGARVRLADFFQEFDPLRGGRVTETQFRRVLDRVGVSTIGRLHLAPSEIAQLVDVYRSPNDPALVCYRTFMDDMDQVFAVRELEKCPGLAVSLPPPELLALPRRGAQPWEAAPAWRRAACEAALAKASARVRKRRIALKPFFQERDRHNRGHVPPAHFRRVLQSHGVSLSVPELDALEARYCDEDGVDYFWFLRELEPTPLEAPKYGEYVEKLKCLNGPQPYPRPPVTHHECDVAEVLAKVKGKVVREGIRVQEFLRPFDAHNEDSITVDCFLRGLSTCRFDLSPTEMETLVAAFASVRRPGRVDWRRFATAVEEAVTQGALQRAPLVVPLQHLPHRDGWPNHLDFCERKLLHRALATAAATPFLNMEEAFEDRDHAGVGMVTAAQALAVLDMRRLLHRLTAGELKALLKGFRVRRGINDDFDYKAFCRTLHLFLHNKYRRVF